MVVATAIAHDSSAFTKASPAAQVMRKKLQLQPQQSLNTGLQQQVSTVSSVQGDVLNSSGRAALQLRCRSMFTDSQNQIKAAKTDLQKLQQFVRFSATSTDVAWAQSGVPSPLRFVHCLGVGVTKKGWVGKQRKSGHTSAWETHPWKLVFALSCTTAHARHLAVSRSMLLA